MSVEEWGLVAIARRAPFNSVTVLGVFVVSRLLSEPNYDVMLAWNPDSMPTDWEEVRARYFALSRIRAAATWAAFALFLAALVDLA